MAVRNESVRLTLEDNFSTGMARAAAATAVLNRELHNLDGSRIGNELREAGDGANDLERSSRRASPEINRLDGRLRLFRDTALTLGPAVVRLGAGALPVLTGAVAGLGAAAGALGVTILAFHGLGDALDALDAYRLEPTAQNLEKLRIEQEKLGPAGAEFARYIANLEPTMRDLQNIARGGLFPGVEDGIDALLTRGPQVERIISELATGMGNIARDAGEGLSSQRFTPFFDYIESDARPTMEAFAASTGNVALGVANMLVAFAPLTRDFTGGLEDATAAFAQWTEGLADNQSFQNFVNYVRESGPQTLDFFTALTKAFAGLLEAAAPFASLLLPVLTDIVSLFADVAQSNAGPALYAAAAGLIAFNRAAAVTSTYGPRMAATFASINAATVGKTAAGIGLLALSMSDLDDKAGLTNTTMGAFAGLVAAGPTGLAVGAAVGQILDLKAAYQDLVDVVSQADEALRSDSLQQVNSALSDVNDTLSGLNDPQASLLGPLGDNLPRIVGLITGETDKLRERQAELQDSLRNTGGVADLFGETIGQTADQMRIAAGSAEAFSGALARLNGWFDKRDAVRAYKDAIDELRDSMKNGFTREDAANLDNIGRSILQVAQNIKNPGARATFLAEARAQLVDMANNAAPKAKAAIREVIAQFDDKGLTHPKIEITADDRRARAKIDPLKADLQIMGRSLTEPKIGANDNPFRQIYGSVKGSMREANNLRATPRVSVDPGRSLDILSQIRSQMAALVSKTITVTVKRVGAALPQFADGGYTGPGGKHEPAGIVHAGEVVIPQDLVKRDWPMLKSRYGNLPGFADGGVVTKSDAGDARNKHTVTLFGSPELADFLQSTHDASRALRLLQAQLDRSEKALDKEAQKRDEIASNMAALNSSVQGKFSVDLGAKPSNPWASGGGIQAQIAQANAQALAFPQIIAALQAAGLTGPALQQALQEMDFGQLQALAANPGQAGQLGSSLTALYAAQGAAGGAAGQAVYGAAYDAQLAAYADQLKETRGLRNDVKRLEDAVKAADHNNQRGQKDNADRVGQQVNGAAGKGRDRSKGRVQSSFGRLKP